MLSPPFLFLHTQVKIFSSFIIMFFASSEASTCVNDFIVDTYVGMLVIIVHILFYELMHSEMFLDLQKQTKVDASQVPLQCPISRLSEAFLALKI
jgi:hypothetical protein